MPLSSAPPEIELVACVPYVLESRQNLHFNAFSRSDRAREVIDDPRLTLELGGDPDRTVLKMNESFRTRVNLLIHSAGGRKDILERWVRFLDLIHKNHIETAVYVPRAAESAGAQIFMKCRKRYVTPEASVFFHAAALCFSELNAALEAQRLTDDGRVLVGGRRGALYLLDSTDIDSHRKELLSLIQGSSEAHHRLRARVEAILVDPGLPRDDLYLSGRELYELGEVELVRDSTAMRALLTSNIGTEALSVWHELEDMMRFNP